MCRSCGSVACSGWHLKLMDHQTQAAGLNQILQTEQRGTNILNKHCWETVGYAFYSSHVRKSENFLTTFCQTSRKFPNLSLYNICTSQSQSAHILENVLVCFLAKSFLKK